MRHVTAISALPQYMQDVIASGADRCVCPRCDGGTHRESSLSIRTTDSGVVTFKCFRASCGWYGLTVADPNAIFEQKKIKIGRVYRDPTHPLAGHIADSMVIDYGLKLPLLHQRGWRQNEARDTLIIPVRDRNGLEIGCITRTVMLPEKRVYTFKATARPWLDMWIHENTAPVVVVEDCLSAARLYGLGYSAVALMGTSLSNQQAQEISLAAHDREIILALDRDAFDKSLQLRRRHRNVLTISRVLCLTEDIKNIDNDNDIRELIDGRDSTTRSDMQVEGRS